MTFIGFIIGFTIIIMSAREVYYREVFKMEDKNIRHYWMSIAYIAMLPFMPLCDFAKQYTLCTAGLMLITFIIEGTHEAVDEGYYAGKRRTKHTTTASGQTASPLFLL